MHVCRYAYIYLPTHTLRIHGIHTHILAYVYAYMCTLSRYVMSCAKVFGYRVDPLNLEPYTTMGYFKRNPLRVPQTQLETGASPNQCFTRLADNNTRRKEMNTYPYERQGSNLTAQ